MKILFENAKVLDVVHGLLIDADVEVTDSTITNVRDFTHATSYDRVIDCQNKILSPGFVNTHAHTPMTLLRSFKDDVPLHEWLFDNILPTESTLTPEDIYWGEYLGIAECIKGGITTIEEGYFHNDMVLKVAINSGIRMRIGIGPTMRDVGMTNAEYLKKELTSITPNTPCSRIKPALFVHSIYTTNDTLIKESVDFAKAHSLPLTIHLAETQNEVDESIAKYHKTPTKYLDDLHFFDVPTLCYHSVYMSDEDISILASKNVSVSTCPASNLKLASGIADLLKLHQSHINISIGTDGASSNNSLDMFREMYLASTLSKVKNGKTDGLNAIDILQMATINGAKALGFDVGVIEKGKPADIILIDTHLPHYYPLDNTISNIVYSGKSSDVTLTMIDGKIVYEDGKYFIGEDIEDIYSHANAIRSRIKK